jgi:sulfatase modifying factor 1
MKHPLIFNLSLILILLAGCSKSPITEEQEPVKAPTEPVLTAAPVEGEFFSIPDINLDMLWCKPGTFMMGSPEDETQYEVTLTKGFWLAKYEVTEGEWVKVMGMNRYLRSNGWAEANPVERISWNDAMEFCKKLTQTEKTAGRLLEGHVYTLPTEAQWEYACRAGTTTAYSFGNEISPEQANFNTFRRTPVGTYPANTWGFHDLHGNLSEWCFDWYGVYPNGSINDPFGPSDGTERVLRGGSYRQGGWPLAMRNRYTPGTEYNWIGFRLSLQTEKKERSDR